MIRGSLKPFHKLSDDEFKQKVHEFKLVFDLHYEERIKALAENENDLDNAYWDEH